jgi:hypothetical protein
MLSSYKVSVLPAAYLDTSYSAWRGAGSGGKCGSVLGLQSSRATVPPPAAQVRVFLSGFYTSKPESDFELSQNGKTLLFVSTPRAAPIDRAVFGTVFVRPINVGSRSLDGAEVITIYSKDLWNSSFEMVDRKAAMSIRGAYDSHLQVEQINNRWFVTRNFPRIDPMTAAPLPVSFLLQMHGVSSEGGFDKEAAGQLEIIFSAPDLIPVRHVLDIRCIAAVSTDEFIESSRAVTSSLRSRDYPDIPVILALTSEQEELPVKRGPVVMWEGIKDFVVVKSNQTVNNF